MRIALMTVLTFGLLGCSGQPVPSSPSPIAVEPTPIGSFTVWVLEEDSNSCVIGATIEIERGQAPGQRITQLWCPDWWSAETWITFSGVEEIPLTLRVSAPGYVTTDMIVVPLRRVPPDAVFVRLARIQ